MILSGILLTPTGEPYKNSSVRITSNNTSPSVLMFVHKDFKTDVDGAYSIDVPNGWYRVSVYSVDYRGYTGIGNIEITDDTTQTTINELLMLDQTAHSDGLAQQVAEDAASAQQSAQDAEASADLAASLLSTKTDNSASLLSWAYVQAFQLVSSTRDVNSAIISASIVWPDGKLGVFTTDVASIDFPGAIDAWHATYLGTPSKLITQPTVTRDANGAVITQPAITIV